MSHEDNDGAIEAWDTVLFDKFVRFRRIVTDGFAEHGARPLRERPYAAGARVLDVGCGFGDTTLAIAEQVGPSGQAAVGVDCAERFIRLAQAEARARTGDAGRPTSWRTSSVTIARPLRPRLRALRHDVLRVPRGGAAQHTPGTAPGGELTMVVWRRREDNPWVHEAERAVRSIVPVVDPEASDQVHCGPGPFSMAGADPSPTSEGGGLLEYRARPGRTARSAWAKASTKRWTSRWRWDPPGKSCGSPGPKASASRPG